MDDGYSVCRCTDQWKGEQCDEDVNECDDDDSKHDCVLGREVCRNKRGGFECDCVQGWMGDDCGTAVDSCRNEMCLNGGWCEGTKCKCPYGISGYNCQFDRRCANNACKNGATCLVTATGYRCQCTDGYDGRFCSDDTDECDIFDLSDVCPHQPVCVNTMGGFSCCPQGRRGADCTEDIDECENPESCHRRGQCINTNPGYRCECAHGYNADEFCAPSCSLSTAEPTLTPPPATNDGGGMRLSTASAATGVAGNTDGDDNDHDDDDDDGTFESPATANGGGARSSVTAATDATGLPGGTTPRPEARAGDGDGGGGGGLSSLLDYWYYAVAALAVLIALLALAAYLTRSKNTAYEYYDVPDSTVGNSTLPEESYFSLKADKSAEGLPSLDVNTAGSEYIYEYYEVDQQQENSAQP